MGTSTNYVVTLSPEQITQFRELMSPGGWTFDSAPYAHWRAKLDKTTVVAYQSGKVTVQGKGTADLVQFILEPKILGEVRFGYEHILAEEENPRMFTPHAGIDESGKGDYFGPLVIAAAYVDAASARRLLELGVVDSKAIKNDRRIASLAESVRAETQGRHNVVAVGPDAYNRLYDRMGNVNRILAWGHATALENLLEIVPDCPRAISDQFGRKDAVPRALQTRGRSIEFEQCPKAESDIAVAAASILARAEFVRRLEGLSSRCGTTLPKGAGKQVDKTALRLASKLGVDALRTVAKWHFRTTEKALSR